MNKIKLICAALALQSCYIDDVDMPTYVVPDNLCDCVYYDEERGKWDVIKLQPGTRSVGWLTYSRRAYCEEVIRGYLTNCN